MKFLYKLFRKAKIIHSIPGRIRILVPGLKNLSQIISNNEEYILNLIKILPGIKELTYSTITEKVLVYYDSNVLNEKEIMNWVNKVENIMIDNVDMIENLNDDTLKPTIDFFQKELMKDIKGDK